jgi:hypothetical protein
MRNKAKISLVIFSAVLLSACTTKAPGVENQAGDNQPTETEQSSTSSLRDLLAMGKNQKCIVTTSTTNEEGIKTDTIGTIYISGKNVAQEVSVTSSDKKAPNINMRMISDGTYMYSWDTSKKTPGMKIKMTEPSDGGVQNTKGQSGSVDFDNKVNMKCSGWSVDNGMFTIPSDVKFTDLSEMMKNIPTMPANIPTIPTGN